MPRPNPIIALLVVAVMLAVVVAFGWACIEAAVWLGHHTTHTHCTK